MVRRNSAECRYFYSQSLIYDVQIDVYGITVNVSYIFLHIATYIDTLIRDSSPFSGIEHPFTVLQWFRQPVPG